MMPNIPMTAWEQISVVVVFAILLGGLGWVLVKVFTKAIADINNHYGQLIKDANDQWRNYFDARSETSAVVQKELLSQMAQISHVLGDLVTKFEAHDTWERGLQDGPVTPKGK